MNRQEKRRMEKEERKILKKSAKGKQKFFKRASRVIKKN